MNANNTLLTVCLSLLVSTPLAAKSWSTVTTPSNGKSYAIGQASSGCIAGAQALPLQGEGFMAVHLERHRYYGHPNLIQTLQTLAKQAQQHKLGVLQIGDLGQPRGGAMPFGHRSHQTGLDADIWFNLDPKVYANANSQRSNLAFPSMLTADKQSLNRALWTDQHVELLQLAAQQPEVDRIFVNPHIKKALCEVATESRDWLRKIRPWFFHDDHFHIRLRCPDDSPECQKQAEIPEGDGCGAELMSWFPVVEPTPRHAPAKTKPPLPKACLDVLNAP